jgi:hypothetical protein
MSIIEFPYTLYKGYLLPIIPITVLNHWVWVFVDSGAAFTILNVDDVKGIGIDWQRGSPQMIMVGDGDFIPVYFHDLSIQIDKWQVTAPVGFSERLGVGFNLLGRKGIFDQFQVCFNDHIRKVTFQKI